MGCQQLVSTATGESAEQCEYTMLPKSTFIQRGIPSRVFRSVHGRQCPQHTHALHAAHQLPLPAMGLPGLPEPGGMQACFSHLQALLQRGVCKDTVQIDV